MELDCRKDTEMTLEERRERVEKIRNRLDQSCIKKISYRVYDELLKKTFTKTAYIFQDYRIMFDDDRTPIISGPMPDWRGRPNYGEICRLDGEPIAHDIIHDLGSKFGNERGVALRFGYHTRSKKFWTCGSYCDLKRVLAKDPEKEIFGIICGRTWHLEYLLNHYIYPA